MTVARCTGRASTCSGIGFRRKRPAHLVVIGDGGDPFGTEPLETICTSALNCADLRIEPQRIHRLIGDAFDLSYAVQVAGAVRADVPRSR